MLKVNFHRKAQGLAGSERIWLNKVLNNYNKFNRDWVHSDGTSYVDWKSGEPNNASGDQFCAIAYISCTTLAYVFCEPDPSIRLASQLV